MTVSALHLNVINLTIHCANVDPENQKTPGVIPSEARNLYLDGYAWHH